MAETHDHGQHPGGHDHDRHHAGHDHDHRHGGDGHDHHHDGHDRGHHHGIGGHHHHAPASFGRAFAIGIALNVTYVVLEAIFGLKADSLALLSDAGHNLSDVLGLLLAWGGAWLAGRGPTPRRTYGYKRGPVLASLANAVILLVAIGAIGLEAIRRLIEPAPVATGTILWVAVVGVIVNAGTAWLFMAGRKDDLNIRGAFLHMAADAGVTVGVIIAALLIQVTGWLWLDPAVSLLIALVVLIGTWGLLRDSVDLAMDAVPRGIDHHAVGHYFRSLPGVIEVHDLHIWAISTTETALTAHLVRVDADADGVLLHRISYEVRERFGIGHATVQFETSETAQRCELRSDHVV
ncbi:MAG: cation diffusion facilitator family transporter [Rhodopila sp.]